jgi:hypothetical protein
MIIVIIFGVSQTQSVQQLNSYGLFTITPPLAQAVI